MSPARGYAGAAYDRARMVDQLYVHGDAVVTDGRWWCEHELDGNPPVAVDDLHRQLDDPGTNELVRCPDCGTGWVCWPGPGGQRLAKPVVVRIS